MKVRGLHCRSVIVSALYGIFSLMFASAQANELVVTTTADYGAGSLRQTIATAASGDVITFSGTLSGQTITLDSFGQINVTRNLIIDASSLPDGIAIDGNHTSRILDFSSGTTNVLTGLLLTNGVSVESWPDNGGSAIRVQSDAVLTINNCTLSGNDSITDGLGGGIYNQRGRVTINNSVFSGNGGGFYGGGIHNEGTLTVNNSTLSGNSANYGGGICNVLDGTMTVNNSTLNGNSGKSGGGIHNEGTLTVNNSTLSGNSADSGGGIHNNTAPVGEPIASSTTLNQCTLAGNTASKAGGGVYNYMGWTFMTNCTIVGNTSPNGAGAHSWGDESTETEVAISIVAGNSGSDLGVDDVSNPDAFLSARCNLIGNGAVTYFNKPGDTTNHTASSIRLAPIGDYGGSTQTMPPLPGSPAINAGTNSVCLPATDQRGYPRIVGGTVDIGACESGFAGCFITSCIPSASGMALKWTAFPMWKSTVMYSTNLVTMPFTGLTTGMVYPNNSFTDTVHRAGNQCFYKIEIAP